MAWTIDHDDKTYVIHQDGRKARWLFLGAAVVVVAMSVGMILPPPSNTLPIELMPSLLWLPIAFLGSSLTITIEARFDRTTGRLTIEGSRWFRKRWSVDVPLTEVESVEATHEKFGTPAWASAFARVRLRDGRKPVIWFPGRWATERVSELNAWLARG